MIALYFLLSALIALAAAFARQRRTVKRLGAAFYLSNCRWSLTSSPKATARYYRRSSSASTRQARSSSRC